MTRHLAHVSGDTGWMSRASCTRSHIDMFPTDEVGRDHAKAVCEVCPVREPCGEYALNNDIDAGVWGGLSEADRRRIKRELNRKATG